MPGCAWSRTQLYVAYLQKFFSNHRAVQALHTADNITMEMLEAASRELTLTEQDVSNLMAIAQGLAQGDEDA